MPEIIKLKKKKNFSKKKTAAYCRVSTQNDGQEGSYTFQISHYDQKIRSNPEWEFAGIYSDHGITGTSVKKRTGFQKMIKACDEGKIDLILTKSIKRFARNTVDLLETIRHLRQIGVEVIFEQENISSISPEGDFMLTILTSFAQEESRSLSENVKWSIRKRFQSGEINFMKDCYGYRWVGDQYEIVPEEAEVVKSIFYDFTNGKSLAQIIRDLNAQNIRTSNDRPWTYRSIYYILKNVTYTGNLLLQKFVNDDIKHEVINKGHADQYFVPETHEPIIPIDVWQSVQSKISSFKRSETKPVVKAFSGKLFCRSTGLPFYHRDDRWWRKDVVMAAQRAEILSGTVSVPDYVLKEVAESGSGEILKIEVYPDSKSLDIFYEDHCVHGYEWKVHYGISSAESRKKRSKKISTRATNNWKGKAGSFTCFAKCAVCNKNFLLERGRRGNRYRLKYCKHSPTFAEADLQKLVCDVLELDAFSEDEMDKYMSHCTILGKEVTFHFWDGHQERRFLNG